MDNYVIVGGSSGIGLEVVRKLHAQGKNITVLSRTGESLKEMSRCNPSCRRRYAG
jgi:short-subunit dehydrogenase